MVDTSTSNPQLAAWIFAPENLPVLQSGLRMKGFKVIGASSITKQKTEFELLLRSGPMPNPKVMQIQQTLQQAAEEMQPGIAQGLPPDPKELAMVAQLQQMEKTLPPLVSTVPVAQDESELHTLEASQCLSWLNSSEGQKFKYGTPEQRAAFTNVKLHWSEHMAMAKQIALANAPPMDKPPSESISVDVSKMPANVAIQALAKMKINASPADFAQHAADQLNQKVQAKAIPEALKGEKPKPPAPPGGPPRQLRR
jgi:hypothetical protein